ncbi:MAG: D-sedoheptulose 7-phosphate isomerase [Chlamydiales bacterium]|jgi:D-sedoheptulose 7-phosphate isomerase
MVSAATKKEKKVKIYGRNLLDVLESCIATDDMDVELPIDQASDRAVVMLRHVKSKGKKVILVGNGGSSALVAHVSNDLCKCDEIPAMVCTEQSLLTALTNDEGYDVAFAWQISLHGTKGDLLIAVSSSGQSENIIKAVEMANEKGMKVITFSGFSPDNVLRQIGELNFYMPSSSYGMVELSHSVFCHYLTDRLAVK